MNESIIIFRKRVKDPKCEVLKKQLIDILEKENIKYNANLVGFEEVELRSGDIIAEEEGIVIPEGEVWKGTLDCTALSVMIKDLEKVKDFVPAELLTINEEDIPYSRRIRNWEELKMYLSDEMLAFKRTKYKYLIKNIITASVGILIPISFCVMAHLNDENKLSKFWIDFNEAVKQSNLAMLGGLLVLLIGLYIWLFKLYYKKYLNDNKKAEKKIQSKMFDKFIIEDSNERKYKYRNECYTKEYLNENPLFEIFKPRKIVSQNMISTIDGKITFSWLKFDGELMNLDARNYSRKYEGLFIEVEKDFSIESTEYIIDKVHSNLVRKLGNC